LYANNSMLNGVLAAVLAAVPGLKVWGARCGGNLTVPAEVLQYASDGRVPGIAGNVDRNRGSILRNTAPTTTMEDHHMLAKASNDDYISVPCDGKRLMFVAAHFVRTVDMPEVYAIPDTGGKIVPMGRLFVDSDRSGPVHGAARHPSVSVRYIAKHDFTIWCA
jgi:hypothetical protein